MRYPFVKRFLPALLFALLAVALYAFPGEPGAGLLLAAVAPFPIDPELVAVAMGYENERMIADDVLPRTPVGTQEYVYYKHELAQTYTIPTTTVGRTSAPNQVEFRLEEMTGRASDRALDDRVPERDVENAPEGFNPIASAAEGIMNLIMLDREKRTADIVFDLNTYNASLRKTLSGTSQFSDFDNSDPIEEIESALNQPVMRPNIMVIGHEAYSRFRQHPALLKAYNMSAGDTGLVPREYIAELFELDAVLVGASRRNTANRGQTVSLGRVWGKHIALLHRNRLANPTRESNAQMTFGFSAQFGDPVAGSWEDEDVGMRGGRRVRVGESVDEQISAPELGYFFQNVVS